MRIDRRSFLTHASGAAAAAALAARPLAASTVGERQDTPTSKPGADLSDWPQVRALFDLDPSYIHLAGMLLASHPAPVREAIERHRAALDANPTLHWIDQRGEGERRAREAAARYLDTSPDFIALTDSTTMGLATLYNGLDIREDEDILQTTHDHSATNRSLAFKARRCGATVRQVPLYDDSSQANADEIVSRLKNAIGDRTRIVAVTWVHSCSGVKLPIRAMADAIAEVNRTRGSADRPILFCVDGVHGFGIEDTTFDALGCDFLVAGTHKWLFGPRGTGIICGREDAWPAVTPTIPTFSGGGTPGDRMTPGGFHSFEHRWALGEAFDLHRQIGKSRVQSRIHELNRRCKEGLAAMDHVTLYTPMSADLSSGIICFDIDGMRQRDVVERLLQRHRIIGSTSPYDISYARLTPGLLNDEDEVDRALEAIATMT